LQVRFQIFKPDDTIRPVFPVDVIEFGLVQHIIALALFQPVYQPLLEAQP
jgi:hypothetical protein